MWLEETISPSTSTSGTTRVSKRVVGGAAAAASPFALWPKRKFSPTQTCVAPSRSTSTWSMKSCASRAAKRAVERDDDELLRRRARAISSALRVERRQQLRLGCPARRPTAGAARRSATVSAPRITSRWPRCTPSNVADGDAARPGLDVGEVGELHARKPTTGLSAAVLRGSASAIGRPRSSSSTAPAAGACGPPARERPATWPRHGDAVRARRARRRERRAGRTRERVGRAGDAARRRRRPTSNGPIARAAQLHAVGVAEVGDQRAHVGARRALDREAGARSPSRQSCSKRWTVTSRSGTSTSSPRARQRVGAPAADLDRAVGRRALADARRSAARAASRRHAAGVRDLALGVAGRRGPRRAARRSRRPWAAPSGSAATRVARPSSTSSSPVANGSSVPAWPTLTPRGSARRTAGDDVVRRRPGRLVDEQDAVHRIAPALGRGGRPSCAATCVAQERDELVVASSVEKPAAWRWPPPPPRAGDRRDVDAAVGRAQRDLARTPSRPASASSRTSAATFVPSTARRWSTMPSV